MAKPSQASLLVELALDSDGIELFHTGHGEAYVRFPVDTHLECWPVRSNAFRRWLARRFFLSESGAPGGQGLTDAQNVLEGLALFDGKEHEVGLRLAEHEGDIYLDLGDPLWRAARVHRYGWEIVTAPPVRFRRPRGMLALPDPARGGDLRLVRPFINIDDADWPLLAGWLVGTLRPRGPYAVLLVHGEQGSAKSTLVRVSRALVDPNAAPVRREPRNGQDLIIAARNGLVVAFDNVSHLAQDLSDDLARLATGSGFGARQLFTDLEEIVVHVSRPVAMNGISEFAVRGDLLDRALILNLPTIGTYRDEDEFWRAFAEDHPLILGALLDAASTALANQQATAAPNIRMADFARWVTAAEPALGFPAGTFVACYRDNRAGAVHLTLESSPLSTLIIDISVDGFEGTATELLARLNALADEGVRKQRDWPKAPNVLSGRLRRLAPALRRVGVFVEFPRGSETRTVSISTSPRSNVTTVTHRHSGAVATAHDDDDDVSQPSASGHMAARRVLAPADPSLSTVDPDEIERLADLAREVQR